MSKTALTKLLLALDKLVKITCHDIDCDAAIVEETK
jgi:hypothetical protein